MKHLYVIVSLIAFFSLTKNLNAHSVQMAYCTQPNGDVRLYMEHWHGNISTATVAGTFIDMNVTSGGVTTFINAVAQGTFNNNTLISALPCDAGATMNIIYACPGLANTYNEWVYFDFPPPGCEDPLIIDVLGVSGTNTFYFDEGCAALFPSTFSETFEDIAGPILVCPPDEFYECIEDVPANTITTLPLYYSAGGTAVDGCTPTGFAYLGETQSGGTTTPTGTIGCPGNPIVLTRTYQVTDSQGNSASCSVNIYVQDDTAPASFTCPSDLNTNCDAADVAPYTSYAQFNADGGSALDVCDIDESTLTFISDVSDGMMNPETVTRTYQIQDFCGRTITCTQNIIVNGAVPPTITCPAGYGVNCKSDIVVNPNDATVSGVCDGAAVVITTAGPTLISGTDECPGAIYELTYTATVDATASASCSQLISIDPVDLTISCPANQTLACTASLPPPNIALVTASSNCPSENPVTVSFVSDASNGATGCSGDQKVVIRTYRATDGCGNTIDCTQTFTFNPNTPPTISCTAPNETVNCLTDINPSVADVTITSACNLVANVTIGAPVLASGSEDCNASTYSVTYTVTDECGQSNSCNRTYTLNVAAPIVVSCPPDLNLECDGDYAAEIDNWILLASSGSTLNATSDCDQDLTITANYTGATAAAALSCDAAPLTVTFTVTDECGQTATCTSNITATDTGGPVITQCSADLTLECDGDYTTEINTWIADAIAGTTLIATDAGDPDLTITSDYVAGTEPTLDCNGTTGLTVTFTVTDDAGNAAMCSADIIITDITEPNITTCPADLNLTCDGDYVAEINAWLAQATGGTTLVANDDCDSTLDLSHNYTGTIPTTECDAVAAAGLIVTFFAVDDCGNTASCQAKITITDETAPSLTCPAADLTLEACDPTNQAQILSWINTATATDVCDGAVMVMNDFDIADLPDCTGSLVVNFSTEDDCGNITTCTATINVADNSDPEFILCPTDINVNTGDEPGCMPIVNYTIPIADDDCGITSLTQTAGLASGAMFPIGTTTITYLATDGCGNTNTCSFDITVIDDSNPSVECPVDVTVCVPAGGCTYTPSGLDPVYSAGCSGMITLSHSVSGATVVPATAGTLTTSLAIGINTVTYTVTKDAGLPTEISVSCSFNVTVKDCGAPTITCPADMLAVECGAEDLATWLASVSGSDDGSCSTVDITESLQSTINGCGNNVTYTYLFTATDNEGNSTSCTASYGTVDTTSPTITTCAPDINMDCNTSTSDAITLVNANLLNVEATDGCGSALSITSDFDGIISKTCGTTKLVTITVTDDCGNSSNCTFNITTTDAAPPTITSCPTDLILECDGDYTAAINAWVINATNGTTFSATDDCNTVTYTSDYVAGSLPAISCTAGVGGLEVTFTATDVCGNESECTATIFIEDNVAPTITACPSDLELECDGDYMAEINAWLNSATSGATITTTDDCDANLTITSNYIAGSLPALVCSNADAGLMVTFTIEDECGNESTCSAEIKIIDNTAPVINNCPEDLVLECDGDYTTEITAWLSAATAGTTLSASDGCDDNLTITSNYVAGTLPAFDCSGASGLTVAFTVEDDCNNTTVCTANIIITDTEPPTVTCPPNDNTLTCTDVLPAAAISLTELEALGASIEDDCSADADIVVNLIATNDNGLQGCAISQRVVIRTYEITDACGNSATCTHTFEFQPDLEAPTIVCPNNEVDLACDYVIPPAAFDYNSFVALPGASISDNCSLSPFDYTITSLDSGNGNSVCGSDDDKVVTRTYTITDACGNATSCAQTFTFASDTEGPVINTCVPNVNDIMCGTELPVPFASVNDFQNGGGDVEDQCSSDASISVTSNDVDNMATGCGADVRIVTRTYTFTDLCGNQSTCDQVFTFAADTEMPTVTCIPDILGLSCGEAVPEPAISITAFIALGGSIEDDCSDLSDFTISHIDVSNNGDGCGATHLMIERTYTITDACGNSSECMQMIMYSPDNNGPTVICPPPNSALTCGEDLPPVILDAAQWQNEGGYVLDDCSDINALTFTLLDEYDNGGAGCGSDVYTITREYEITDICGNATSCEQVFNFVPDVEGPTITCPADDATLGCITELPAPDVTTVTVTDNCSLVADIVVEFVSDASNGANGCEGNEEIITRTYKATDACGNTSFCTQIFTIEATVGSVTIDSCPTDVDIPNCGAGSPPIVPVVDLSDVQVSGTSCGSIDIVLASAETTFQGCQVIIVRTYRATDQCGNFDECTQTITYTNDFSPPFITGTTNLDLGCNPNPLEYSQAITAQFVFGFDNCMMTAAPEIEDVTLVNGCDVTILRTYTYTDYCGNESELLQTITYVNDTGAPSFTNADPLLELGCINSISEVDPNTAQFSIMDDCEATVEWVGDVTVSNSSCNHTIERTYRATDDCDNETEFIQTITYTLDDSTPVIAGCITEIDLGCFNDQEEVDEALTNLESAISADDGCQATLQFTDILLATDCINTVIRTWTATDQCDNEAECTQTISYTFDDTNPVFSIAEPLIELGCINDIADADIDLSQFTITDNCNVSIEWIGDVTGTDSGCSSSIIRTYRATDDCDNTTDFVQTLTYTLDSSNPSIIGCQAVVDMGCNPTQQEMNNALNFVDVTDGCEVSLMNIDNVSTTDCLTTISRTWIATDACNNEVSCDQVITFTTDTEAPIFVNPINPLVLDCINSIDDVAPDVSQFTITENCNATVEWIADYMVTDSGCATEVQRTYRATDDCGNETDFVQTVTYTLDGSVPQINGCVATVDLGCFSLQADVDAALANLLTAITADDGCAAVLSHVDVVSQVGCEFTVTRDWSAIDGCNNEGNCQQIITYTFDDEAPIISGDAIVDLGCLVDADLTSILNPATSSDTGVNGVSVSDNCTATLNWIGDISSTDDDCEAIITRTWDAVDDCGNMSSFVQTITYTIDDGNPTIAGCTTNTDLGCFSNQANADLALLNELSSVSANDMCLVSLTHLDSEPVNDACLYTVYREWTAVDACLNQTNCQQTFTYTIDSEAPVITATANIDLGCITDADLNTLLDPATSSNADIAGVSVSDNCEATLNWAGDIASTDDDCQGNITRRWEAEDACGNTSSVVQFITYTIDDGAPEIQGCQALVELGCFDLQASADAALANEATIVAVSDACFASIEFEDETTIDGCMYTVTRDWTATDACNNQSTCQQIFTYTLDAEAPVFAVAEPVIDFGCVAAIGDISPNIAQFTVTDNCEYTITWEGDYEATDSGCSTTIIRTYRATDGCGNFTDFEQTLLYTLDSSQPEIVGCESLVDLGCNPSQAELDNILNFIDVIDGCDASVTNVDEVVVEGCVTTITRTWTATDACNNEVSCEQTIFYTTDTEAPIISGAPSIDLGCLTDAELLTILDPATSTNTDITGVSVADNCEATLNWEGDISATDDDCEGNITRTWDAVDGCGNTSTFTQNIIYTIDDGAPTIAGCIAQVDLGCFETQASADAALANEATIVSATDGCFTGINFVDVTTNVGCLYTTTRDWTATDACNNQSTCQQIFTFTLDAEAPVFAVAEPVIDFGCVAAIGDISPNIAQFTVTDNCEYTITWEGDYEATDSGCSTTIIRTYRATDGCGNFTDFEQTLLSTLDSSQPEIVGCESLVDLGCNPSQAELDNILNFVDVIDGCDASVTNVDEVTVNGCVTTITRTWTAIDACNNEVSCEQTIFYTTDTEAPVFEQPELVLDLGCINSIAEIAVDINQFSLIENCQATIEWIGDVTASDDFCQSTIERTYRATDGCGNSSDFVQTLNYVLDNGEATIDGIDNQNLGCFNNIADLSIAVNTLMDGVSGDDNCELTSLTSIQTLNGNVIDVNNSFEDGLVDCANYLQIDWSAIDACNNSSSYSQAINFTYDDEAPIIVCPIGADYCSETGLPVVYTNSADFVANGGTISDNCTLVNDLSFEVNETITTSGSVTTYTRTYTVTDECGNTNQCEQVFNIVDYLQATNPANPEPVCVGGTFAAYSPGGGNYNFYTDNGGAMGSLISNCANVSLCAASDFGIDTNIVGDYLFWITEVQINADGSVCESAPSLITFQVIEDANAELSNYNVAYCDSDGPYDLNQLFTSNTTLGGSWYKQANGVEIAGGLFGALNPPEGCYQVYYAVNGTPINGVGDCGAQSNPVEICVCAQPEVSFNLPENICSNNGQLLIMGNSNNGVWTSDAAGFTSSTMSGNATFDPSVSGLGTFDITYTINENCSFTNSSVDCENSLTQTITVVDEPYWNTQAVTICAGNGLIDLSQYLANGTFGGGYFTASNNGLNGFYYDPSFGDATFNYVVNNGCVTTNELSITVANTTQQPVLSESNVIVCASDNLWLDAFVVDGFGGTWSGPGVTSSYFSAAGINDVSAVALTYTVGTQDCDASVILGVTIVDELDAAWSNPGPFCSTNFTLNLNDYLIGDEGGTWFGNGVNEFASINDPLYGLFDPTNQTGTFTVGYTVGQGDCSDTLIHQIQITDTFDASWINPGPVCADAAPIDLNGYVTGDAGGTFTGENVISNIFYPQNFNADNSASLTYTVGYGDCEASLTMSVEVNDTIAGPTVQDTYFDICSINDINNLMLTILDEDQASFAWYMIPDGGFPISNTTVVDVVSYINAAGTYNFYAEATTENACPSERTEVTIVVHEQPTVSNIEVQCYDLENNIAAVNFDINGAVGTVFYSIDNGNSYQTLNGNSLLVAGGQYHNILLFDQVSACEFALSFNAPLCEPPVDCTSVYTSDVDQNTICSGTQLNFSLQVSDSNGNQLIYLNDGQSTITMSHSGNGLYTASMAAYNYGCAPLETTFTISAFCNDGETSIGYFTEDVTIYPNDIESFITVNIDENNCGATASVTAGCENYIFPTNDWIYEQETGGSVTFCYEYYSSSVSNLGCFEPEGCYSLAMNCTNPLACNNDAGLMQSAQTYVCADQTLFVSAAFFNIQSTTNMIAYYMHTSEVFNVNEVIASSTTGMFNSPGIYNTPVYVSSIVGPATANGLPDLNHTCTVIAPYGAEVIFLTDLLLTTFETCHPNGSYSVQVFVSGGLGEITSNNVYNITGDFNVSGIDANEWVELGYLPSNTSYTINVDDVKGCGTSYSSDIIDCGDGKTGSDNINIDWQEGILLYPNPTENQVFVNCRTCETLPESVKMYNAVGQLMAEGKIIDNSTTHFTSFDLSEFAKGVYIIEMEFALETIFRKVIHK